MAKAEFVESLEQDFLVEDIQVSSDEDEAVEKTEELPVQNQPKGKKTADKLNDRIGNSKRKKLTFDDLGLEVAELPDLHQNTFTALLDKLYVNAAKPLYVKSHTKIKVLIVSSSALRCLEIIKELKKSMPNVRTAKLFARHMKVHEQIESLKQLPFLVGVGTPARLVKLLETDPDAMKLNRIEYLIIDGSWRDGKNMSILDLPETHLDLKKLADMVQEHVLGIYSL